MKSTTKGQKRKHATSTEKNRVSKERRKNRATKMEKVEEYKTVQSQCPVCGKAISSSPDMKGSEATR